MQPPFDEEIEDALDLAAGMRLKSGISERQTASRHDVSVTRKMILLFLESLDTDLTVGELRERLET